MYNYLKQRIKHAIRFRHKRGYGVHSPFVYDLITRVIREKGEYYDCHRVEDEAHCPEKDRKLYRLLFRLTDYFGYRRVACVGLRDTRVVRCLGSVASDMSILDGGANPAGAPFTGTAGPGDVAGMDLLFLGRDLAAAWTPAWDAALRRTTGPLCVVLKDIYKCPANARLWRQLRQEATVSIDMMWYGLLFWNEKLQKGKYNLII